LTVTIKSTEDKITIIKKLKDIKRKGKLDALKHCGKIKLNDDPMTIQKKMRDEW
jgi:hypothetical protein